jgi:hypothetical protein
MAHALGRQNRSLRVRQVFTRRYAEPAASDPEVRESFLAEWPSSPPRAGAPRPHHDRTRDPDLRRDVAYDEGFVAFVRSLRADAFEETPRPVVGTLHDLVVAWERRLSRPDRPSAQADRAPAPRGGRPSATTSATDCPPARPHLTAMLRAVLRKALPRVGSPRR